MDRPSFSDLKACVLGNDLFARVQCIGFPRGSRCTNCIPVHLVDAAEVRFNQKPEDLTERHVRDILCCLLCDRPTCGLNTSREARAYLRHWSQELRHMDFHANRRTSEYSLSHGFNSRNKAARARPSDSGDGSNMASTPHPKTLQADVYVQDQSSISSRGTAGAVPLRSPRLKRAMAGSLAASSIGEESESHDINDVKPNLKTTRDIRVERTRKSNRGVVDSTTAPVEIPTPPRTPPSPVHTQSGSSSSSNHSPEISSEHLPPLIHSSLVTKFPTASPDAYAAHPHSSRDSTPPATPPPEAFYNPEASNSSKSQSPTISLLQRLTTPPPPRRRHARVLAASSSPSRLPNSRPIEPTLAEPKDTRQCLPEETPISPLQDWERKALDQTSRSGTPSIVSPRIPAQSPPTVQQSFCLPLPPQKAMISKSQVSGSLPGNDSVKSFEIHVAPVISATRTPSPERRNAVHFEPASRSSPDLRSIIPGDAVVRGSLSPRPSPLHQVSLSVSSSHTADIAKDQRRVASSQDLYQARLEELAVASFEPAKEEFPKAGHVWSMFTSMLKGYTKGAVSSVFCIRSS